jgi:hypothetical protein
VKCDVVHLGGGGVAFVCGGRGGTKNRRYCVACLSVGTEREAPFLCDHEAPGGKTCDKGMCHEHRRLISAGVDWCRDHATEPGP